MTRSELVDRLFQRQAYLAHEDVELAVYTMLGQLSGALVDGERVEIRGFGSFTLRHYKSRIGRNPRTGEVVPVPERHIPHFKPGKELRERVNTLATK
jgi:integration host factor subunit beta